MQFVSDQETNNQRHMAVMKLWVDPSIPGLREWYQEHIHQHNQHVENCTHPNSGFDVCIAHHMVLPPGKTHMGTTHMAKLGIKAEMSTIDHLRRVDISSAYWLLPRSSLSKTPLMQSNHIGLIDMGYRGEIMAPLRNLSETSYTIEPQTRLFQLCHPHAYPIHVVMVDNVKDLSLTERGEGGFGSTGI
jgi:deoxyuridine 5'-triphosphate nucleotidohydrolase